MGVARTWKDILQAGCRATLAPSSISAFPCSISLFSNSISAANYLFVSSAMCWPIMLESIYAILRLFDTNLAVFHWCLLVQSCNQINCTSQIPLNDFVLSYLLWSISHWCQDSLCHKHLAHPAEGCWWGLLIRAGMSGCTCFEVIRSWGHRWDRALVEGPVPKGQRMPAILVHLTHSGRTFAWVMWHF